MFFATALKFLNPYLTGLWIFRPSEILLSVYLIKGLTGQWDP